MLLNRYAHKYKILIEVMDKWIYFHIEMIQLEICLKISLTNLIFKK